MRFGFMAVVCVIGLLGGVPGCGASDPDPALTITPAATSGSLAVVGPTAFSALLTNSTDSVTWSITGGGALSVTAGYHTSYTPPTGAGTATLTATAGGLTASVALAYAPLSLTDKQIPGLTAAVTVQYDTQDIPHIKCATTLDCIAVQGFIQAQDRFFPMDFLRHVARARLAELIGDAGLSQDLQLRALFMTRSGARIEDALAAAIDNPSKAVLTAFANGVNAYLGQLKAGAGKLPSEYLQLPFPIAPAAIDPWTIQDTLAMARLQQFQLSETLEEETAFGQFAAFYQGTDPAKIDAWIRAAAPATEQAHTLETTPFVANARPVTSDAKLPASIAAKAQPRLSAKQSANLARWQGVLDQLAVQTRGLKDRLRPADASVGSNNWVIGKDRSATGFAMVANDPHLSLQYPPLFHLSVMTSTTASDNLDLAGGAFPGIPGALVGRGAHVGWGVTVVGYDVTDLYLETLDVTTAGCSPSVPCVKFKNASVPMIPVPQTFMARTATGLVNASTLVNPSVKVPPALYVVPHHGPIVQLDAANLKAVSVRWTGQEGNTQDIKAILGLNTAVSVDAAITALKDFSTGAQNFVLADDQGNIAFDPHALVPVRSFIAADKLPWFPLPGDGSAEWGDGTSACATATTTPVPASCWLPDAVLPQGKNPAKGYYFTANADPLGVSDNNNPLDDGKPYFSFNWDDSSGFRATRIEQMIEAAIADHQKLSVDDLMAIQSDHQSRPGKAFLPFIDAAITAIPAASRAPELAIAQGVLDQWGSNGFDCPSGLLGTDPKASPVDTALGVQQSSAGCFLFHELLRRLATNVFTDDLARVGQSVNGLYAIKAMLYMLSPAGASSTSFCNDVDSKGTSTAHTCREQLITALVQAVDTLTTALGPKPSDWVWGRVHTIQPVSLLALVTNGFQPGPYARPGGAFTVDVGSPDLGGSGLDFEYRSGGNVRHISLMDPTKPVVKMQLPGPERDGPTGFLGPDLLGQWVKNTYFDFLFGSQIDGAAVSTQSFKAP